MPTGYTNVILEKPEITFEAFALRCARAFGVCIAMREESLDAPPPTEIRPDVRLLDSLHEAEANARKWEVMSLEEASRLNEEAYADSVESWERAKAEHMREKTLFGRMLAQVNGWSPPTSAHEGLKKFMAEQLATSMPRSEYWAAPRKKPAEEFLAEARKSAAENVHRRAEDWRRAQAKAAEATEWLRDLRRSLEEAR